MFKLLVTTTYSAPSREGLAIAQTVLEFDTSQQAAEAYDKLANGGHPLSGVYDYVSRSVEKLY